MLSVGRLHIWGALLRMGAPSVSFEEILMPYRSSIHKPHVRLLLAMIFALAVSSVTIGQNPARSPSDTVREFYRLMRDKKFREAFDMSIYRPAIDGLNKEEFDDLRSDFDKMAAVMP